MKAGGRGAAYNVGMGRHGVRVYQAAHPGLPAVAGGVNTDALDRCVAGLLESHRRTQSNAKNTIK